MSATRAKEGAALIRTPDQRLRVFVSSTLHELAEERRAAKVAIERLRLAPVMFELGARPHPPRELYRAYLAQSHIFVGIYWQRYGWIAPGETISGLEDEYKLASGKPKLIYVKGPASQREPRLGDLLESVQRDDRASYKGFETAEELRELIENDLALLLTERFEDGAAPAPAERIGTSLPVALTPLIGREREIAAVCDLLQTPEVRLVTLLGPGGIGKTRLALAVAERLQERFDPVVFVPLAAVQDAKLVLPSLAHALGVREQGGRVLFDSLRDALVDSRALFVLDNFEQVIAAAPRVAELLAVAPQLKVLVTSREVLRLSAEYELAVSPLELPGEPTAHDAQNSNPAEAAAVRLFVERARAVKAGFALSPENAAAVAEICRRLDGLPLAIELAAARVRLLPPPLLLARMTKRLPLLTSGGRDLPERQQTLRATIDWSYKLLNEGERRLLARLAVFVGGCRLEAAERVCEDGEEVLERLIALADKNLVRLHEDHGGEPRVSFLETIREYALEALDAAGETAALRRRHATYFLELAEGAVPGLKGAAQPFWSRRLEKEHDNLRAALAWAAETGETAWSLRLGVALRWFWMIRGHYGEGRRWLESALEAARAEDEQLLPASDLHAAAFSAAGTLAWRQADYARARAQLEASLALRRARHDETAVAGSLLSLGTLAFSQGDYARARGLLEEGLALQRARGDESGAAASLLGLGNVALDQGRLEARRYYQESLAISRALGDKLGLTYALDNLGVLAWHEVAPEAQALTEEALVLYRELGSRLGVAGALHRLGLLAFGRGEHAAARGFYEESLVTKRALGDARGSAFVLYDLSRLALAEGDLGAAQRSVSEGLVLLRPLQARTILMLYVEGLAALARRRGDLAEAARLFGAAAVFRRVAEVPVPRVNRDAHARELEALREALGSEAFAAAWAEGERLELEEAAARLGL